ncbi:uncharacterized protein LOC124699617 isoform X2 [Lolium rigidum]|uniref:uncharacterized protein LOC124699617 isoform X2 n=1 Tax=Lolium rigidum TaxID=89674 RepID=UPI001F5D787D|nr:uncharacterized protein LOC124699617 isoform X2 [Lolium rigidum]
MPRRSHCQSNAPIDLDGEDECKSKRSRTCRTPTAKSSNRIASSKRDKTNQDKLDTHIFDLYIEGHWSLLVLCHFDETDCSDTKKGPRMLLLDSLNQTDPTRLQSDIRRFIRGIYETEEREESVHFINKIRLEFPKVPQQNGEECGIYVLYFIHCFLHSKKLAEVLENKKLDENFGQLFHDGSFDPEEFENFRKDVHSFQVKRNTAVEDQD